MLWRASLADGRTVDYDGQNSPQSFLDLIVRFDLLDGSGARKVSVRPDTGERVIYRRRTELSYGGVASVSHVVGILDRESGLAFLSEYGADGVLVIGFVPEVELTPAEVA